MVANFAHRGASAYYPENTKIAFEKAIELGCDVIETDVHMTSDGVLVLIHDDTVDRTTDGRGFVKNLTYEEIRKLDAGSWFDKKYKGEKIPSAEELLKLAKDKNVMINYEFKTGIAIYPEAEIKLINLIKKYDMQEKIIFSSFIHSQMAMCKLLAPNIRTALLCIKDMSLPLKYYKLIGANALNPEFNLVTEALVNKAHKDGTAIYPYTVNNEIAMNKLIDLKVDGIITNYPDKLRDIIKKKGPQARKIV